MFRCMLLQRIVSKEWIMKRQDSTFIYKMIALGAVGLYMYKTMQENGGTLNGNPNNLYFNSDKLVDHIMVHTDLHPNIRPFVESTCKKAAEKILHNNRPSSKVKDVN